MAMGRPPERFPQNGLGLVRILFQALQHRPAHLHPGQGETGVLPYRPGSCSSTSHVLPYPVAQEVTAGHNVHLEAYEVIAEILGQTLAQSEMR